MIKFIDFVKGRFINMSKAKSKTITTSIVFVIIVAVLMTISCMRKTIVVNVDGKEETFVTYNATVGDLLKSKGIDVSDKDKLQPSLDSKLKTGEVISLKKAIPVNIAANGENFQILTAEETVGDILENEKEELKSHGVEFDESIDETNIALNDKVNEGEKLQIIKVEKKEIVSNEAIPFDTIIEKNSDFDVSYENVKTEGAQGQKEVKYEAIYKDGKEISREIKSTKVVSEPKNKILVKGTEKLMASRGEGTGSGTGTVLKCSATAYSGGWGTSSGRKPRRVEGGISTIAVDPTVIPMGTKVYIDGYGYAVAADTGTGIKGNKIDVYFNSYKESCDWGLKEVNVKIIAEPGKW